MERSSKESTARRVEKYRRLAELRQQCSARSAHRLNPDSDLAKRSSTPRASTAAATRAAISGLATLDPALAPKPCCGHGKEVRASSCCRSDSRSGRCLASISRDVRKTQCQVAAQGDRVVADLDLLRTQLLARLTSIQISLHALAGTPITAREILSAPDGTFVISQSGHYTLAEDVTITGTAFTTPVIDIRANDVVLDLGSFVFKQDGATLTTGRVAIQISGPEGTGASNVTVQNGTIRGFMGFAEESFYTALNVLSGSDLITLQSLRFLETGADSSFTTDSADTSSIRAFFVSNLIVRQSVFDGVRGNGLRLASVQGLLVEDVLMTKLLPSFLTAPPGEPPGLTENITGVSLFELPPGTSVSNDITIRRAIFEDFHIAVAAGTTVAFAPVGAVVISNRRVPVPPTVGTVSHNILIEDVLARRFSIAGALNSQIIGVDVTGAFVPTMTDIRSDPVGGVFRRVAVQDLSVAAPVTPKSFSTAIGIRAFCQQSVVEDCVVQDLVYTGEANPSKNSGCSLLGVFFRGDGFVLRRCSAMGLDATRYGQNMDVDATGFETCICGVVGGLVEENYAGDNAADPSSETAGGFAFLSTIDTVIRNNVAADNNFVGFGAADLTVPSKNNLYQSNTVTGSVFAGFWDMNTDSNSAYIDNFARSAQFNYLRGIPPFSVLPLFGAQIVQWSIPAPAPTANITKLTNLSVSP